MRRSFALILLFIPVILACGVFPSPALTTEVAFDVSPSPTPSVTSAPLLPSETPSFTPEQINEPVSTVSVLPTRIVDGFKVNYHPDGPLYVGDLVSLEVVADGERNLKNLKVLIEAPNGEILGPQEFGYHGIGRRSQATFLWAWDTSDLNPGEYTLTFSLLPSEEEWTETVNLFSPSAVLFPEPDAHWVTTETQCCLVHYISGTAAERDLPKLLESVNEQVERVSQRFDTEIDQPISITFLPRVLGHGGFASEDLSISYLDRNYAGNSVEIVLGHEIIHELDSRHGGDFRPTMFVEGLAVYLNGGHFKPEPLMERAAALLPPQKGCQNLSVTRSIEIIRKNSPICGLNWFIPIEDLVDNFYFLQHEISYLQTGALVEFLISTWGWETFDAFYRDTHSKGEDSNGNLTVELSHSQAINNATLEYYGMTLEELEEQFLDALSQVQVTAENLHDVRLMVGFFDTVRRYQQALDPSAYFLTAWLTDGAQMREREIVADYLRRPISPENLATETMLVNADMALRSGNYAETDYILNAVNSVLEAIEEQRLNPFSTHPLAANHLAIVQVILEQGYQPQKILIKDDVTARAWVIKNEPGLILLNLVRMEKGWQLQIEAQ